LDKGKHLFLPSYCLFIFNYADVNLAIISKNVFTIVSRKVPLNKDSIEDLKVLINALIIGFIMDQTALSRFITVCMMFPPEKPSSSLILISSSKIYIFIFDQFILNLPMFFSIFSNI